MAQEFGFEPVSEAPYYFISYNSQDSAKVGAICREMNRRGVPLWYDRGLLSGEKWEKQITAHIRNCHEVILFVTRKLMARENPYVYTEYAIARKLHKKIHIVMLDEIQFEEVSDDLKGWFVNLETLHGVYPPADAAPVQIVNSMERLIQFIGKQPEPLRDAYSRTEPLREINSRPEPQRENYSRTEPLREINSRTEPQRENYSRPEPQDNGSNTAEIPKGSTGNGLIGAVLGALLGAVPYFVIKEYVTIPCGHYRFLSVNDLLWLTTLPISLLTVVFYKKYHGFRSLDTAMKICLTVSLSVALISVLPQAIYLHSFPPVVFALLIAIAGCMAMKGVLSQYVSTPPKGKDLLADSTEGFLQKGIAGAALGAFLGSLLNGYCSSLCCTYHFFLTLNTLFYVQIFFTNLFMVCISFAVGILTVIYYKKFHGICSKKTLLRVCMPVSIIVQLATILLTVSILRYPSIPFLHSYYDTSYNIHYYLTWNHPGLSQFIYYSVIIGPALGVWFASTFMNKNPKISFRSK